MKKIKVFLGGYVNYLNAQNINCYSLSKYLDKNRFKVSTILHPNQHAEDFQKVRGVSYIQLRLPARIWRYYVYLKGIATADVAYLPKGQLVHFCKAVGFMFNTRLFTTVEGLLGEPSEDRTHIKYINKFAVFSPYLYAITNFLAKKESKRQKLNIAPNILPLGVEYSLFATPKKPQKKLTDIVFIGNKLVTKGIFDFFEAADNFPNLHFHIIGGDDLGDAGRLLDYLNKTGLKNVTYHGRLNHTELSKVLSQMDLMFFPSRSEGFPKVQLETACSGVPTLCYPDYGAAEWIQNNENGFIVNNINEAKEVIKQLEGNPETLHRVSILAIELGRKYDWMRVVKIWESEIEKNAAKR